MSKLPTTLPELRLQLAESPETVVQLSRPAPAADFAPITAGEFTRAIEVMARGLRAAAGGDPGRVAIVLPSGPEWHVVEFAICCAGGVSVPTHYYLTPEEIAFILASSGTSFVILDRADRWAAIAAAGDGLAAVRRVWIQGGDATVDDPRVAPLAELTDGTGGQQESALPPPPRPDDLATILYTSGTTGKPKGVRLTHRNLMAAVGMCIDRQPLTAGHVALSFLPLSHVFERVVSLVYFTAGVQIAYSSPATLTLDLPAVHPHYLTAVPRVFEKVRSRALGSSATTHSGFRARLVDLLARRGERILAGEEDKAPTFARFSEAVADQLMGASIRKALGGRLISVISGGAPLGPDLLPFFYGCGVPVYEGYGLSETAAIVTITPPGGARGGSVGTPCKGSHVRIVPEAAQGAALAAEETGAPAIGEIQVKGDQVFGGYDGAPDETSAAFTDDGWFRTGDLGALDADGYLSIRGRSKHVIVTSWGKKVTPGPMEDSFARSPVIERAIVVGEGRPFLVLLVEPELENLRSLARERGLVPAAGPALDLPALLECKGVRELLWIEIEAKQANLSQPERVRTFCVLPEPLTIENGLLTPTMKVRRHVVLERYRALVEDAYGPAAETA